MSPSPGDTPQETAAKNDPMSDKIQQEIERETGRRTRNTTYQRDQDENNQNSSGGKVKVIKAKKPNNTTGSVNSSYEPEGESIQEINVIKNRQTLANAKGDTKIRNFFQKKKDDARQAALKKIETAKEEFSCWREEFIWETDKKYPDKVKEIKPMTGKNTITINPEDETSKYKRGY